MEEVEEPVLLCTPRCARRLPEVAGEHNSDLRKLWIRTTIHAGEPGASIPATRQRIEQAWYALAYDHAGLTEVGAFGFACIEQKGIHVNEGEFIAEVINPASGEPVQPGEVGKLVLTNLDR